MCNTVLEIENLAVGYRNKSRDIAVVDGINASLREGELVALIGRNGSGKSTLLRTIAAYHKPLSGKIAVNGVDIDKFTMPDLAKLTAVVLTDTSPIANMKVRELVSLGRIPYTNFLGTLSAEDNKAVESAIERMGIISLVDKEFHTLSDGEKQKCMIAKALAQETKLLLLDEPSAFLDYPSRVRLLRTLKRLAVEEGKAVLLSTHGLELAIKMADRLWVVSDGRLVAGTADELQENGALKHLTEAAID